MLLLAFLGGCAEASPLAPSMRAVEEIRGRSFTGPVRNVTIDRSELTKHLEAQMAKGMPYSIQEWGRVLRALQLVDVEPAKVLPSLLQLYEAQVLAFYDPHSHTYYSIRQLPKLPAHATALADPKLLEETVMVHELVHALQDQHFSLASKEKALMRDTDANLAYHAVLEGEALLVMVAHMLGKAGVDLDEVVKDDAMLEMITSAAQAEQMLDPSTPPYFAEMLKFPYIEGLKFVVHAYRQGGWKELDRVHANPPRSTREILHPAEYFTGPPKRKAFDANVPADALVAEHLGQFHWRFLAGAEAAAGWVDDRVVLYKDGRVHVTTQWETPVQAEAFRTAYGDFLKKRGVEAVLTQDAGAVTATYVSK